MEQQLTRIAVKIGSNVLTRRDGTLDVTRMSALVDQVAELHKAGVEIILVSSGAVASGRSEIHPAKKLDSVDQPWGKPNSSTVITNYSVNTVSLWGRCSP